MNQFETHFVKAEKVNALSTYPLFDIRSFALELV
jgi:hypothetical protein